MDKLIARLPDRRSVVSVVIWISVLMGSIMLRLYINRAPDYAVLLNLQNDEF
jgi:hypothetical protein